jgi:hypothetical protein
VVTAEDGKGDGTATETDTEGDVGGIRAAEVVYMDVTKSPKVSKDRMELDTGNFNSCLFFLLAKFTIIAH